MPATCTGGDAPFGGLVPAITVDKRTDLRQWAAEKRFGSGFNERKRQGKEWK